MSRARRSRILAPVRPDQSHLNRQLRQFLAHELQRARPVLARSAAECRANRYRKHFDSFAHASLLLFHGLSRGASLRQSYAAFGACPGLVALSGLGTGDADGRLGVSYRQVAASNTSRPAAFLAGMLPDLLNRARHGGQRLPGLPPELSVIDSTFLSVSATLARSIPPPTSPQSRPGLWATMRYEPAGDLPDLLVLTDHHQHDCQRLDTLLDDAERLATLRGTTLAFDLGFYSHARFARLRAAGIHVVTRLHHQASHGDHQSQPVQASLPGVDHGRITVLADQRLTLGSPNNRAGAVLPDMRLVTAVVDPTPTAARQGAIPITYRLVTDRWDLSAETVVQIYLWRWLIELFFRWLKSHLHLAQPLGYSRNALELTVYLALIVHLVCLLAADAAGLARRSPLLLSLLPWALARLDPADLCPPASSVRQLRLPGLGGMPPVPT